MGLTCGLLTYKLQLEYWLSLLKVITIVVSIGMTITKPWSLIFPRSSLSWALLSTVVEMLTEDTSEVKTGTSQVPPSWAGSVALPLSLSPPHLPVSGLANTCQWRPLTPADGGTESIAITAGETKDPTRNLPKVVKNVFWRIILF